MDANLDFKWMFFEILYQFRAALATAQPIKTAFISIQQILQYGDLVYDTASNTSLKKLETKQNFRNKTIFLKKFRHQSKFLEKNKGFSQKIFKKLEGLLNERSALI